jgi:hypothetical protein
VELALLLVGVLVAVILGNAGIWKTFEKAGLRGADALNPISFTNTMIQMAGLKRWKIPLWALPLGPLLMVRIPFGIARRFDKGRLFGLGLLVLPFVFFPILGFGRARYAGGSESDPAITLPSLRG